jgi:hypothetical protein
LLLPEFLFLAFAAFRLAAVLVLGQLFALHTLVLWPVFLALLERFGQQLTAGRRL